MFKINLKSLTITQKNSANPKLLPSSKIKNIIFSLQEKMQFHKIIKERFIIELSASE